MPKETVTGEADHASVLGAETDAAVRMVRQLREELGTEHGDRAAGRRAARLRGRVGAQVVCVTRDVADGLAGPDAQRVVSSKPRTRTLNQEVRELRRANEILKRASAFFAAELDRPQKLMVAFIDQERDEFDVESICRVLPIASSTYYAAKRREVCAVGHERSATR